MKSIRLAVLWHMHQPYYRRPGNGFFELPWVRTHALKDYYGMVRLLEDYPGLKMTFNLVPSLLSQIEDYLNGGRDLFQEVFDKSPADFSAEEAAFLVRHFFSINHQHHIRPYQRYQELYQKREVLLGKKPADWRREFKVQELRDLQVWFMLTNFDREYRAASKSLGGLLERGRDFSEADKEIIRECERELLALVIPEYRRAQAEGRIEISTSPYYHPILPLLCDPQAGRRANPRLPEYDLDFNWSEDAREQLRRGLDFCRERFDVTPAGVWPSEGSLSEPVLDMMTELGISWTAADEGNLGRSLKTRLERDHDFRLLQPDLLYRPYQWRDRGPRIFFRDRSLSDLVGFYYQRFSHREAASDLMNRIRAADRNGNSGVVSVILDGENAWEFYADSGRPFLAEWYGLLAASRDIRTVTFSELAADPAETLQSYAAGSWINANFDVWIGDQEDRLAWAMLADARQALAEGAAGLEAELLKKAREHLMIAQGSDWFWWFGPEHSTADLDIFDRLFRLNLQEIYRLLGADVPEVLCRPLTSRHSSAERVMTKPQDLLEVVVDGRESDYFEWQGAGKIESAAFGGAMNVAQSLVSAIYYGFSANDFFLRIDTEKYARVYFASGYGLELMFRHRDHSLNLRVDPENGQEKGARTAVDRLVEVSLPLASLGIEPGDEFELALRWTSRNETFQLLPAEGYFRLEMPSARHYADFWQV